MEGKTFPLWNAIAIFGGLLIFVGFFLNMFSFSFMGLASEYGNGIDLLGESEFTFYKVLPLIVMIIAVLLMIYAAVDLLKVMRGEPLPVNYTVSFAMSIVNLLLVVIVVVSISTRAMFDVNTEWVEIIVGAGVWMMLAGAIVCVGSAILAKFNPTVVIPDRE